MRSLFLMHDLPQNRLETKDMLVKIHVVAIVFHHIRTIPVANINIILEERVFHRLGSHAGLDVKGIIMPGLDFILCSDSII